MIKTLKTYKFIVLLLITVFILRLPSLFEPYWYGDENIYLAMGMGIRKSLLLYRDIFDNKPPLIYLLAAVANGTIFWFKFILLVSMLAATYFFNKLGKIILEGHPKAIAASTIFFALLTTLPFLEGNIANAELFILPLVTLGLCLAFRKNRKETIVQSFAVGAIFSLGLLLKAPAVFDFLSLLVFQLFFWETKRLITVKKQTLFTISGFTVPVLLTGIFFWVKGSFTLFFNSVFVQTMGYLSSWETGSHNLSPLSLIKSELSLKFFLVIIVFLTLWLKRKKIDKWICFIATWFIFSVFGATLSGRPYAHYLIQVIPPLCLLLGIFFSQNKKRVIFFPTAAIIVFALIFIRYQFWVYPVVSYYQNFMQFASGQKDKNEYYSFFNPSLPEIYETAEFVAASTQPTDKIFVWADEPAIYPLSKRLPATPYLVAYHILDLKLFSRATESLNAQNPTIILVKKSVNEFPYLRTLLNSNYLKIQNIGDFAVFRQRILLAPNQ